MTPEVQSVNTVAGAISDDLIHDVTPGDDVTRDDLADETYSGTAPLK